MNFSILTLCQGRACRHCQEERKKRLKARSCECKSTDHEYAIGGAQATLPFWTALPGSRVATNRRPTRQTRNACTMAQQTTPFRVQAFNFVLDVANGRHALSKLIPIALWLLDGGLTSLVIWKVPCMRSLTEATYLSRKKSLS